MLAMLGGGFAALAASRAWVLRLSQVEGVFWQPSAESLRPEGHWHHLGVHRLVVQWSAVDGRSLLPDADVPGAPETPDWAYIGTQPWAAEVTLGLAGRFNERLARKEVADLAQLSMRLADPAAVPPGLAVDEWYFPVEVDPTWSEASSIAPLLAKLPKPLWISAYDNENVGPDPFVDWLAGWLPPDVGIFFQDGVGLHVREARVAAEYFKRLRERLGKRRTRLIAEAFRPLGHRKFRPAVASELVPQLAAYKGLPVYLFEGPQYVKDPLIEEITRICGRPLRC